MSLDIHDTAALGALHNRAETVRSMIYRRAVIAYWRALGGRENPPPTATLDMCVMHNSMIAFREGKPWAEVDYSAMRLAIRIQEQGFEPRRIVDRLFSRRWHEMYRTAS